MHGVWVMCALGMIGVGQKEKLNHLHFDSEGSQVAAKKVQITSDMGV